MHWQNDIVLHLVLYPCRSNVETGRKMLTAWNVFSERNNEFILTNKNKSSLNCEAGVYPEKKNNKLKK